MIVKSGIRQGLITQKNLLRLHANCISHDCLRHRRDKGTLETYCLGV